MHNVQQSRFLTRLVAPISQVMNATYTTLIGVVDSAHSLELKTKCDIVARTPTKNITMNNVKGSKR